MMLQTMSLRMVQVWRLEQTDASAERCRCDPRACQVQPSTGSYDPKESLMTVKAEPITRTVDVPGATLTYDIRSVSSSEHPPLFMIALPMAAAGFGTLSGHFTDRTVMTYDPRGSERSQKTDPLSETP